MRTTPEQQGVPLEVIAEAAPINSVAREEALTTATLILAVGAVLVFFVTLLVR